MSASRRAAFLDRDGTLNVKAPEGRYVTSPGGLHLLPGAAEAVRELNEAAVLVVVVTNQRGIARGLLSPHAHTQIMERLADLLAQRGAHIDAVYVCSHEVGTCGCRKPAAGLLLRAASENQEIDLSNSVTVGDAESDIAAGRGAGTQTIRLASRSVQSRADHVVRDLRSAARLITGPMSTTNTRWLAHLR